MIGRAIGAMAVAAMTALGPGVTRDAWSARDAWFDGVADARCASLDAMLAARAQAIVDHDSATLRATFDQSIEAREVDVRTAGLLSVPFTSYRIVQRADEMNDLSAAVVGDVRYRDARSVRIPKSEIHFTLDGVDGELVDDAWITFVQRDDCWYVGAHDDLSDLGLESRRELWDEGPVVAHRGRRALALASAGRLDRAREVATIADSAANQLMVDLSESLDGALRDQLEARRLIIVPDEAAQLERLLHSGLDLKEFVAFTLSESRTSANTLTVDVPRLYIQESGLAGGDTDYQRETLAHEFVHTTAFPVSGPLVPSWVHEGLAQWVTDRATSGGGTPAIKVKGTDRRLPDDFELQSGTTDQIQMSYAEARSAIAYLAETHGESAAWQLIATLGELAVQPGSNLVHLDRALQATIQQSFVAFERTWGDRA